MASIINTRTITIEWGQCDAAGIVFYPRYFEMVVQLIEDWFADGLGIDFHALHNVLFLAAGTYLTSSALQFLQGYTLAGIVRYSMPYLSPGSLTDEEAQQHA